MVEFYYYLNLKLPERKTIPTFDVTVLPCMHEATPDAIALAVLQMLHSRQRQLTILSSYPIPPYFISNDDEVEEKILMAKLNSTYSSSERDPARRTTSSGRHTSSIRVDRDLKMNMSYLISQ